MEFCDIKDGRWMLWVKFHVLFFFLIYKSPSQFVELANIIPDLAHHLFFPLSILKAQGMTMACSAT